MKRILLCLGISLLTMTSQAQMTAEEIVTNYIETIGGHDAWSDITGFKMTAEMNMQGMALPIDMYQMKDGKTIVKFNFQGTEMVQEAFDGETVWSTNFASTKAEKADAEDTENKKRTLNEFPDPFLNYADNNFAIEYIGEESAEGVECYKVKLTKSPVMVNGEETENVEFYYFDKENFIPIVSESEVHSGPAAGQTAMSVYSDYQEVDGLYFPFSITYKMKDGQGQTIEIKSVELNPTVTANIFAFPGE